MDQSKYDGYAYPKLALELITKAQYDSLTPHQQGYAQYWQGNVPGSELRGLQNPYPAGTIEHSQWKAGQAMAAQDEHDKEEIDGVD